MAKMQVFNTFSCVYPHLFNIIIAIIVPIAHWGPDSVSSWNCVGSEAVSLILSSLWEVGHNYPATFFLPAGGWSQLPQPLLSPTHPPLLLKTRYARISGKAERSLREGTSPPPNLPPHGGRLKLGFAETAE